ncbi:hypothetical protein I137_14420 [Salmonella enterica subsp. enterica serovar Pullorum str. S06004]|nr:hypothetical protein I137_14420 [Salmonella enterica subsp. enterica serovar Pullorum str. S06004]
MVTYIRKVQRQKRIRMPMNAPMLPIFNAVLMVKQ